MLTFLAQADPWYQNGAVVYPLLVVAGFVAGIINTIAGGGSFMTLPVLIYFAGLDPQVANATNRVAILLSSGSATRVFHAHGLVEKSAVLRMLVPTLVGVPIGVCIAIVLPPDVFQGVFGGLFLLMAAFFLFKPKLMLNTNREPIRSRTGETIYFLAVGTYCGFIQAGMGLLLLLGLSLFHARELVGANAIKNAIAFMVVLLGLAVFLIADLLDDETSLIRWVPGLVMAVGNVIGGMVGARLAIRKGAGLIFATMIVVMVATGIKLLIDAVG